MADIGRPIGHIKPNVDLPDIEQLVRHAIASVAVTEREVRDRNGHWYALRVRPYKSLDGRIEGAVMSLYDVHDRKEHERAILRARELAEARVEVAANPLAVLDGDLRISKVNRAFRRIFDVSAEDCMGRRLHEVEADGWDEGLTRELFAALQEGSSELGRTERLCDLPRMGQRRLRMEARRGPAADGDGHAFVLSCDVAQESP